MAILALFTINIVVKGLGSGLKNPRLVGLLHGVRIMFELFLNLKKVMVSLAKS